MVNSTYPSASDLYPKVSVVLLTYNHEKFIAQAIQSILMQETNFNYEITIIEDCSTDSTRDIIFDFQKRDPDKIRLVLAEENQNDNRAWGREILNARSSYIALLDGDDYWISPHKLQKQVDFLENHPECSICFHNVYVVYEDEDIEPHPFHMWKPIYHISKFLPKSTSTLEDIVAGNFIQTCSVMFRARLFDEFPSWFYNFPIGDWPLHILNAEYGNIGYLDEMLGVYRVHSGGLWSGSMSANRRFDDIEKMIYMYEMINCHLNFKYNEKIRKSVTYLYYKAAQVLFDAHRYKEARYYARRCLPNFSLLSKNQQKFLSKVILKLYFPSIYNLGKRFQAFFTSPSKGI